MDDRLGERYEKKNRHDNDWLDKSHGALDARNGHKNL